MLSRIFVLSLVISSFALSLSLVGCGGASLSSANPDLSSPPDAWRGTDPPKEGLVGWWPMGNGPVGILDATGNGSQGAPNGYLADVPGKVGRALRFDGVACTTFKDYPLLDAVGWTAMSFTAWVRPAARAGEGLGTVASRGSQFSHGVLERADGEQNYFEHVAADHVVYADAGPVGTVGDWHLVATAWDGGVARHYVDGALVGSRALVGAVGAASGSDTFRIGCVVRPDGSEEDRFIGDLDEVTLYDRALSGAEVADYYARTR